jgi:hypothetical protein
MTRPSPRTGPRTVELSLHAQDRSKTGKAGQVGPARLARLARLAQRLPAVTLRPGCGRRPLPSAGMTGPASSVHPMAQYSAGRLKITARLTILPSRTLK